MDNQLTENNMPQDNSEKTENIFEVGKKLKIPNWVNWVVLAVVVLVAGGAVWRSGNKSFEIIDNKGCIQITVPMRSQNTGECKIFPTPCDVPSFGWVGDKSCENNDEIINLVPNSNSSNNNPINSRNYYQELADKCDSDSCCAQSVEIMKKNDYKQMPLEGCSEGLQKNQLRCINSYSWCEPKKETVNTSTTSPASAAKFIDFLDIDKKITADWKTYLNKTCNYQMKIPKNWGEFSVLDGSFRSNITSDTGYFVLGEDGGEQITVNSGGRKYSVGEYSVDWYIGFHDIDKKEYQKNLIRTKYEDITEIYLPEIDKLVAGPNRYNYLIDKEKNDCFLEIGFFNKNSITKQILANLQFLKVNERIEKNQDTSDWKTYRNEEYGFEVKYPYDWILKDLIVSPNQSSDSYDIYDIGINYMSSGQNAVRGITYCEVYSNNALGRCEIYKQFIVDWELGDAMINNANSGTVRLFLKKSDVENKEIFRKILSTFKFLD